MRRPWLATLPLLVLLLVPAGAATAADRPQDLLVDACRDERVDGAYSQRTYRRALDQLPADSDQYTGCRDVINRARLAALSNRGSQGDGGGSTGSGGGSTGSGGSAGSTGSGAGSTGGGGSTAGSGSGSDAKESTSHAAPSNAERRAVESATRAGAAPVRLGGELLAPGAVRQVADDGRVLPTPLIVLLAALAVCTIAAAAAATWSRVHARRLG